MSALPPGLFNDFVAEGLIERVGRLIVFLPQILLLFFFNGVTEDWDLHGPRRVPH